MELKDDSDKSNSNLENKNPAQIGLALILDGQIDGKILRNYGLKRIKPIWSAF